MKREVRVSVMREVFGKAACRYADMPGGDVKVDYPYIKIRQGEEVAILYKDDILKISRGFGPGWEATSYDITHGKVYFNYPKEEPQTDHVLGYILLITVIIIGAILWI